MSIITTLEGLEKFLRPAMKKVADETSLLPDLPTHFKLAGEGPRNGREALATLVALDFATPGTRNYHKVEHIRNHIAKMAINYNCEGEWKTVRDYLEKVKPFVLYSVVDFLLTIMNEYDLYGNFRHLVRTSIRSIRVIKTYHSVYLDTRPVVKAIRKRGYNDKGSISPLHTRGRNQPRPEKEVTTVTVFEPLGYQWYDHKRPPKYDNSFDYHPKEK